MAQADHAQAPATIKVIELVGVSSKSWSDAAQQA
ncbi:MAG: dodecin domain-containing protein, partial [Candidatus Binatia bacterium]